MKIFKNYNSEKEINVLDLGIVMAGESKEYDFCVYNETDATLDKLNFTVDNSEVTILSYPSILKSKEKGFLKIKYSPSITIKKGLHAILKFTGSEIYS
jgi:DNA-binding XRE family transcriptional regulator